MLWARVRSESAGPIYPYTTNLSTSAPPPITRTTRQVQRFGPGRILHESPEFDRIAARAVARGLPLLVSNPDIVRPGGDNDPMPGLLGQAYERKGERGGRQFECW